MAACGGGRVIRKPRPKLPLPQYQSHVQRLLNDFQTRLNTFIAAETAYRASTETV
jgi:hypothetical protein